MKTHILLIDPIEKLAIKKDSSLLLALALKLLGHPVFLLFKEDLYFQNTKSLELNVYAFEGQMEPDSLYIKSFQTSDTPTSYSVNKSTLFHMRLDPPFNLSYLQSLWILQSLKMYEATVVNDSHGILLHNEKLYAYSQANKKFPSYLGTSKDKLVSFLEELCEQGQTDVILKPVDLFQGEGVTKLPMNFDLITEEFSKMITKYQGTIVVQPYIKMVEQGEIRSLYFDGKELGSIIKIPPQGSHLANIAQGAKYSKIKISPEHSSECARISKNLMADGIRWTAFDILGDMISEVNITCPGLLVEVSEANSKNLALEIAQHF